MNTGNQTGFHTIIRDMTFQSPTDNHPSSLIRRIFRVDRDEIGYIRFTLESYGGMATVTTLDPHAALIEVFISPGCEETVLALMTSLKQDEGLHIQYLT